MTRQEYRRPKACCTTTCDSRRTGQRADRRSRRHVRRIRALEQEVTAQALTLAALEGIVSRIRPDVLGQPRDPTHPPQQG